MCLKYRRGLRKLYLPGDAIHKARQESPQTLPDKESLPKEYCYLLDWYLNETSKDYGSNLQGKKILIIEDEFACREAIRLNLQSKGALTLQAENGDDALIILKNNSFDLITTGI